MAPPQHERESGPDEGARHAGIEEVDEDEGHADDARDDEQRSRPLEDAEGGAGVGVVHDADVPVGVGPGIPAIEPGADQPLRQQIAADDDGGEGEEAEVAASQSGQGEAGHRSHDRGRLRTAPVGFERCRRSPWPNACTCEQASVCCSWVRRTATQPYSRRRDSVEVANTPQGTFDVIQVFVTTRAALAAEASRLKALLNPDGKLWFTYPKGTSTRLTADINRDDHPPATH